ncbi:MAG: cation-translocating P-type ATPase C-terminal domain-containing protein, partial [Kiritimatiellaeota bacterium]|nr:cation-translocating P-type ATPase C-terminal domain-containing protein [Kiritimatiellota bacterium]
AFIVLSCAQLFHAFNCRHATRSLFQLGLFTNYKLVLAVAISAALQLIVVSVPFLEPIFKTVTLNLNDWLAVIVISSLPLWLMELVKICLRRRAAR